MSDEGMTLPSDATCEDCGQTSDQESPVVIYQDMHFHFMGEPGADLQELLFSVGYYLSQNPGIIPIQPGVIEWDAETLQWGFGISIEQVDEEVQ